MTGRGEEGGYLVTSASSRCEDLNTNLYISTFTPNSYFYRLLLRKCHNNCFLIKPQDIMNKLLQEKYQVKTSWNVLISSITEQQLSWWKPTTLYLSKLLLKNYCQTCQTLFINSFYTYKPSSLNNSETLPEL